MKKFVEPEFEILSVTVSDIITQSGSVEDEWNGDNGDNNTGWN